MKNAPCYLYGTYSLPEVGDGFLFHYTKFESFLKILEKMTLRSSCLSKMNDLNEADLSCIDWSQNFLFASSVQDYARNKCSVISFTQNYEVESICRQGANHPAMWAHYAENTEGVCIVLDKEALIKINRDRLKEFFYKLEEVEYTCDHNPRMGLLPDEYSDVSDAVRRNYKEIFFKKDIDWKNEGEVRFLVESSEFYLDIKDAVKYIVLGKRLVENREHMRQMLSLIESSDTLKDYFHPHSFADISESQGGYFVHDASHHIVQYQYEMKENSYASEPMNSFAIDNILLDNLTAQAQASPRLRMNMDLRNSSEDSSQRMLNAIEPGSVVPIHRHQKTSETVVVLRGRAVQYLYDDEGRETGSVLLESGSEIPAMQVEMGQWHRIEALESGTVILEMKDGAYEPIGAGDVMER